MVLLSSMSALSEEQELGVVEYSAEAVRLDHDLEDLISQHESDAHRKTERLMREIGGEVRGHQIRHANGESIDASQFEVIRNINNTNHD